MNCRFAMSELVPKRGTTETQKHRDDGKEERRRQRFKKDCRSVMAGRAWQILKNSFPLCLSASVVIPASALFRFSFNRS